MATTKVFPIQDWMLFNATSVKTEFLGVGKPKPKPKRAVAASVRKSKRQGRVTKGPLKLPVAQRLKAGKGALCRHGKYWYPVRLLQKQEGNTWLVRWWRGCKFGHQGPPQLDSSVPEESLVDELWQDQQARRAIQLGQWAQASELPEDDDILAYYWLQAPYPPEVDEILSPYRELFSYLIDLTFTGPDATSPDLDPFEIPAVNAVRKRLASSSRDLTSRFLGEGILDYGDISYLTHAQLLNWIHHNVPGAQDLTTRKILGRVTDAHAVTIYIAAAKEKELIAGCEDFPEDGTAEEKQNILWQEAWEYQCNHHLVQPKG
ncbi:hypothetical protein GALMADRAFT_147307 [Galerina marginata CBS 339.88]|uniref:Uncharacterized protein n=1 Tax=Galerina marginata (strain CBS 339.88) TaxID=685588 RepID=A0A067S8D9_GALM3|nr:hypothetical protein GALMADRAFT_147307 [Galerina marginata CBS 339.88]